MVRRVVLLAGAVVPVAVYLVLESTLHSDTWALGVSELIAVGWALAQGLWRRQVNAIMVVTAIVLGIALIATIATGGSLPLKLRRGVITGSIGLACLISLAGRRPLLPVLLELVERTAPARLAEVAGRVRRSMGARTAWVLTAVVGVSLLSDAAAQVALALTTSTTVFVGASRLARIAIFAIGVAACTVYVRSDRARP